MYTKKDASWRPIQTEKLCLMWLWLSILSSRNKVFKYIYIYINLYEYIDFDCSVVSNLNPWKHKEEILSLPPVSAIIYFG